MSASAYALRREVEQLRRNNAELGAALQESNLALMEAERDLAALRLPFFRRWRLNRLRRQRQEQAMREALGQGEGAAGA